MPPQYQGGSSPPGSSSSQGLNGAAATGGGKRARPGMGLRLSSGAQGGDGENVGGAGGVSPMSQVPSEKSRH
jgi:hypothetical protein